MNHFVAGILRIVLLEASVALLVIDRLIPTADAARRARRRWASYAVAGLAVLAFTNFGQLPGQGRLVHAWEQYHFFMGSKYLTEIGYFDLYRATLLADRESVQVLRDVQRTRDLHDFSLIGVDEALRDADRVRGRFSDRRWEEFKVDWARLSRWSIPWPDAVSDHGNSGSPAWAVIALPMVELLGSSPVGQTLLGSLDLVLMLVLFVFLFRTFGAEAGAVGLTIWALVPFSFDYLAGSLLRWDWLFALGMAFVCYRRERPLAAGGFLGYAVISKIFPICFVVPLLMWLAVRSVRQRRLEPEIAPLIGGAAAVAVAFALAAGALFGPAIWRDYRDRIEVTVNEKYYPNQYSLKTVFLQAAESTPSELARNLFKPPVVKQSLDEVDIAAHRGSFLAIQLALTAVVLFAVARASAMEAMAIGPFLVYIWLTVNAYYWNMLGLTALVWAARQFDRPSRLSLSLLALHATLGAYYLYQHLNWRFAEGYFVGLLLLGVFLSWTIAAIARPGRGRVDQPGVEIGRPAPE